ncbi:hypothetical protein Q7P37_010472 [Cladosporium fusiforme]
MRIVIRIHKTFGHATNALRPLRHQNNNSTHHHRHYQHPPRAPSTNTLMAGNSQYSDTPSPCRRNHCPSRPKPCTKKACLAALTSRLERRLLAVTTQRNVLNPVLSNIKLIQHDIRHKCDRSALRSKATSQAHARFSDALNRSVEPARCACSSCAIERADRKIRLLVVQHAEARRWLDVLREYRWKYDMENCSTVGSVGR